jgi:quercetin dioxygenase-like cupin family protein
MPAHDAPQDVTSATSAVWTNHVTAPGTPEGFTVRTAYPTNPDGAEMMLERWEPGTGEPPHSHPGDDMTVVVEGKMAVQFYRHEAGALVADGAPLVLERGDVGYVRAGRIHDAKYVDACKLVYVHDGAFAFVPADTGAD